jgi:hypothetical protein
LCEKNAGEGLNVEDKKFTFCVTLLVGKGQSDNGQGAVAAADVCTHTPLCEIVHIDPVHSSCGGGPRRADVLPM